AQPGGPGGPGRGLFAAYLASGLEVIREFTIRVQGLTQAAQPLGPGALSPGQVAELAGRLAELLPLFRVSVAGLTGSFGELKAVRVQLAMAEAALEMLVGCDRCRSEPILLRRHRIGRVLYFTLSSTISAWGHVVSYSAGVSACEKGQQWQRALALLSEMWEAKLEPDVSATTL
ncbi:unnamed protein product, partial [Prorocentrum cordatum]